MWAMIPKLRVSFNEYSRAYGLASRDGRDWIAKEVNDAKGRWLAPQRARGRPTATPSSLRALYRAKWAKARLASAMRCIVPLLLHGFTLVSARSSAANFSCIGLLRLVMGRGHEPAGRRAGIASAHRIGIW